MFDLRSIPEENFIHTVVPFNESTLIEVLAPNANKAVVVDYEKSVLRGKQFITYMGNMNVPSDILFTDNVSKEERFELLVEYMSTRTQVGCPCLAITVACILTAFKGINEYFINVENPVLTAPEIVEFIEENKILVNKWALFFDSTLLFCLSINRKFAEQIGHPQDYFRNVDDPHFIGINFAQLFDTPGFMNFYFTEPVDSMVWFTKQFDLNNYDLSQQNIYSYFINDENIMPIILEMMGSEAMSFDEFVKGSEQLIELVNKDHDE
jgi:hypothetical protein